MTQNLPMGTYAQLPLSFLIFWFVEAPVGIVRFYGKLNKAFFDLFSLPQLLRTFFAPIKNEYRKGLVGFSIATGVVVKSALILFNLLLLIPLLLLEVVFLLLFVAFPILTVGVLFL